MPNRGLLFQEFSWFVADNWERRERAFGKSLTKRVFSFHLCVCVWVRVVFAIKFWREVEVVS